jgi:hypothetical protein
MPHVEITISSNDQLYTGTRVETLNLSEDASTAGAID